jgi:hypothetical protein
VQGKLWGEATRTDELMTRLPLSSAARHPMPHGPDGASWGSPCYGSLLLLPSLCLTPTYLELWELEDHILNGGQLVAARVQPGQLHTYSQGTAYVGGAVARFQWLCRNVAIAGHSLPGSQNCPWHLSADERKALTRVVLLHEDVLPVRRTSLGSSSRWWATLSRPLSVSRLLLQMRRAVLLSLPLRSRQGADAASRAAVGLARLPLLCSSADPVSVVMESRYLQVRGGNTTSLALEDNLC